MNEPRETVSEFYFLVANDRASDALALLSDQIEWTEAKRTPYYTGTMVGVEAIIAGLFDRIEQDFDGFLTTPNRLLAEGNSVVSFGNYSGTVRRTHSAFSAPFVHLWTVVGGRIQSFHQYTDSAPWNEALCIPHDP